MWELRYGTDDPNVLWFTYKGQTFELTSHRYEPLIYIKDGEKTQPQRVSFSRPAISVSMASVQTVRSAIRPALIRNSRRIPPHAKRFSRNRSKGGFFP